MAKDLYQTLERDTTLTPFQKRVFTALLEIPQGKVTTYKELSRHLSCGSAQAIGQALQRNPYSPEIPCHRVIKSDGTLGGFMGGVESKNTLKKRELLMKEGVEIDHLNTIRPTFLYLFPTIIDSIE
ncbi:MAG: MGMT family protein [Fibrobacterales bacterium]